MWKSVLLDFLKLAYTANMMICYMFIGALIYKGSSWLLITAVMCIAIIITKLRDNIEKETYNTFYKVKKT